MAGGGFFLAYYFLVLFVQGSGIWLGGERLLIFMNPVILILYLVQGFLCVFWLQEGDLCLLFGCCGALNLVSQMGRRMGCY